MIGSTERFEGSPGVKFNIALSLFDDHHTALIVYYTRTYIFRDASTVPHVLRHPHREFEVGKARQRRENA
jgi:hypothetical protein